MALQYLIFNGAMQTTAAPVKITTSAAIKTLLQFKPLVPCKLIEWGISFDGSAAATPGEVECIDTGTVAATVTASVNADITQYNGDAVQFGNPTSALISIGTSATGYTASVEGSTTAVRNFDLQQIQPTNQYVKQWPLGREPFLIANNLMRIRTTFGTAVNAYCYIIAEF